MSGTSDDDLTRDLDRIREAAEQMAESPEAGPEAPNVRRDRAAGGDGEPVEGQGTTPDEAPQAAVDDAASRGGWHGRRDSGPARPPETGTRRRDDDLGVESELRLGLEVLEDLLEVAPDRIDLLCRRVRYARRLEDPERRVEAERELVDRLAEDGRHAAAELVGEIFSHDRPGAEGIAERLDELRREQMRRELGLEEAEGALQGATDGLRETVLTEVVSLSGARELLPLFLAYRGVTSSGTPEPAVRRHLAVYLRERGRPREARDVLSPDEYDLPESPDERVRILTQMVVTALHLGEDEEARDRLEQLTELDDGVRALAGCLW